MHTISGGGTFTRTNIQQINENFSALRQPDFWVRPQYGNNNNIGSFEKPFASFSGLSRYLEPGMVIGLLGVTKEEWATPTGLNDVTIRGMANKPRQATTSGVANGGGSTWMTPSGGTGHLLTINGQGWVLENVFMENTAASGACVLLTNSGDGPALANAEHTIIRGCIMTGAKYGIRATGQPNHVTIEDNRIFGYAASGDIALSSEVGAGVGTLSQWIVRGNRFYANHTHISAPFVAAEVFENRFSYIQGGVTTTVQFTFTGGSDNSIHDNNYDVPHSTTGLGSMFVLGTNDRMYHEKFATAVATTIFNFGAPVTP